MFNTSIALREVGPFKGSMVVSMRPYKPEEVRTSVLSTVDVDSPPRTTQIDTVIEVTEAFPAAHGGPVQIGNPESISISDISKPDYGDRVKVSGLGPSHSRMQSQLPTQMSGERGRNSNFLGMWCDTSGCADASKAAIRDYTCPRTYVCE